MEYSVSVIIPVYNAEKTIRRCVESLALGSACKAQIILVDDCSKDQSWVICKKLSEEFPHVFCTKNYCNRGVSYTRNRALEMAQGRYVMFVDSDDWVSQHYIERLWHEIHTQDTEKLILCGYYFVDKAVGKTHVVQLPHNGEERLELSSTELVALQQKVLLQQLWNKVFRRDIIEKHHIRFDESQSMGEDFQFVLDYLEAAKIQSCVVLNEPLYYYIRWNNNSLMSKFGFVENLPEFARMEQLYRISGLDDPARREAMIAQTKRNYVYHIVRSAAHSKQEKLAAVARVMGDGQEQRYYLQQKLLQTKEEVAQLLQEIKNVPLRAKGYLARKQLQKKVARFRNAASAEGLSIISQNCIGGVIYHDLGAQFLSPTVNTFIPEPDFVKLARNLRYYMEQELVMRWEETYPVGMLADVQIHFMHYATCAEAKESWERRKKRINYDRVLVLATDRDGFDEAVYEQWKQISYPKVLFTANPAFTEDAVFFPEFAADGVVGDLISQRLFYRDDKVCQQIESLM